MNGGFTKGVALKKQQQDFYGQYLGGLWITFQIFFFVTCFSFCKYNLSNIVQPLQKVASV